ncbi:glycosyltransferase family 2 protein [Alkalihalobacterium sp. APHAB7]|uniref:glycosyltransferase family 2 protein n=1 Tax=Alkalihalobacterium sp. APHAB7 TaxID=3402081 RepID=UPI003AADBC37
MRPEVSIILTCYNKPETVGKAIESVLSQTLRDWELFIMNDASTSQTTKIIKSYINDPRIQYFNSKIESNNRYKTTRYATLINRAIPLSRGKYISYLTDDSEYLPQRLEIMTQYLSKHPEIDIVYSGQKLRKLDENFNVTFEKTRKTRGVLQKAANVVDHCSVMHTRRAIEKVGEKYNSYWDDHPSHWHNGDAVAWARLNEFYKFYPIDKVLDINYKTPHSFQMINKNLPDRIPDGTLIKGISNDIFLLDKNIRRRVTSELFQRLKYNKDKIVIVPDPFVFKYPLGPPIDHTIFNTGKLPNCLLVKGHNSPRIYIIQNSKKRLIRSPLALERYNLKYKNIVSFDEKVLKKLKDGPQLRVTISVDTLLPDGILFRCSEKFFISEENCLYPIEHKYFKKLRLSIKDSVSLSPRELDYFKQGKPFSWSYYK